MSNPHERIDAPAAASIEAFGLLAGDIASDEGGAGDSYYSEHLGEVHDRTDPHWLRYLGSVADHIVSEIMPTTVHDMGFASGLLVQALRDRGVIADGTVDTVLMDEIPGDLRDSLQTGSALEPLHREYDLITCIEVTERLPAAEAEAVIANVCAHTGDVIFASAPGDYGGRGAINICPPEQWAEVFARLGFRRDLTYDATYLASWAMRFRRGRDSVPAAVRRYEEEVSRLREQVHLRDLALTALRAELHTLQADESEHHQHRIADEGERLRADLAAVQRQLVVAGSELRELRESGVGRIARLLHSGSLRMAPSRTRRRRVLHRALAAGTILVAQGPTALKSAIGARSRAKRLPGEQEQYDEWRRRFAPDTDDLVRMRHENRDWSYRPLVSIVMPTYNAELEWLGGAIDSVLAQVYDNWELCIADDASTTPRVTEFLSAYAARDSRIRIVTRTENGGIAAASASALELATGEYVGLLDHDDLLQPHALYAVVQRLQLVPHADLIYSDEDLLLTNGVFGKPHFKPSWSPDLLLCVNYVCHFLVIKRDLIDRVGGFRGGFDGAQDHDLVLRTTEKAKRIEHIADVLYSWRQVAGSVALADTAKMYAYDAGVRAVEEALTRRNLPGRVSHAKDLGRYQVRLVVHGSPEVAILIPTRNRVDLLRECIDSIEAKSTYRNWTITIIDNDTVDPNTLAYLATTKYRVVRSPGSFNYSRLINFGRRHVEAPYLLTLNNDVAVITPDWIEALLEHAQRPEVGVVGARLLYPDGRPQHEGIAVGNVRGGYLAANLDALWLGRVIRNVSAVSGACQMIRATVFDRLAGYDEGLAVAFNDVDFCLRALESGHLVVYTPYAELFHRESASRGTIDPPPDYDLFWARWGADGGIQDRYLSPHVRDLNPLELRLDPLPMDH